MDKLFNRVVHFEIHALDPERAIKFYTEVFDWSIKKWEATSVEYWLVATCPENTPNSINGGLVRRKGAAPAENAPISGCVCVLSVKNIDETLKKVTEKGGRVAIPKSEVPNIGFLAYFEDTERNIFGIWQDAKNTR
ncbi:VOC family protein [Candidatus Nomurabacteria bacterium]|nr:VOC family protein [Candidatus Nomurabacteria bacterium]